MAPFPTSPWQMGWGWDGGVGHVHILIKADQAASTKMLCTLLQIDKYFWAAILDGLTTFEEQSGRHPGSGAVMAKSRGTGQEALAWIHSLPIPTPRPRHPRLFTERLSKPQFLPL